MTDAAARLLADAYAAHAPACRLYARSLSPEADDATHEAFVRLARRLVKGEAVPEHCRAWLLTAVRSAALDMRRRTRRRQRHEVAAFADGRGGLFEPNDSHDAATAEGALMRLTARQREAVVLRIWCDLSFEAIAALTGTAASTAHADFTTGIDELRRRMSAKDER